VTDPGKRSKAGRLALVKNGSSFKTVREEEAREQGLENLLVPVFKNGDILSETSFAQVRERALEGL
jgi:nicotinamide phosphoribosyltransferase